MATLHMWMEEIQRWKQGIKTHFVVRSRAQSRRRALLWANFSTAIAWAFMQAEEGKIFFAFLEASVRGKRAFSSILHAGKRTKPAFKKPGKNGGREKKFMAGIRGDGEETASPPPPPPSSMISIFPSAKRRRSKHDDPGRLA